MQTCGWKSFSFHAGFSLVWELFPGVRDEDFGFWQLSLVDISQ